MVKRETADPERSLPFERPFQETEKADRLIFLAAWFETMVFYIAPVFTFAESIVAPFLNDKLRCVSSK